MTTHTMPEMPEPDGWIGANDLDPDAGVEGLTISSVRALQLATWNAALEAVAMQWDGCEFDAPGGRIDIGSAIRSMKKDEGAALGKER